MIIAEPYRSRKKITSKLIIINAHIAAGIIGNDNYDVEALLGNFWLIL